MRMLRHCLDFPRVKCYSTCIKSLNKGKQTPDILIHAHVYYPELWDELADCIDNIDQSFDLYVTTVCPNDALMRKITDRFAGAKILVCENKGFDIAPFFKVLDSVDLDSYRYLIKIHTKSNISQKIFLNGYDVFSAKWRNSLL